MSANSTITASTSTGSIASLSSAVLTGKDASASFLPKPVETSEDRSAKSSAGSVLDPNVGESAINFGSAKPAYRVIDDSFANTTLYNDASFMPRRSFEDESVALNTAPSWPPKPGVVLVSPLHPPTKPMQHPILSPSGKRPLEEVDLDDFREDQEADCPTIRKLPKSPAGLVSPHLSARKIAKPPRRSNINPNNPPRFDLEAPALPSFAGVMAGLGHAGLVQESIVSVHLVQGGSTSQGAAEVPQSPAVPFTFGSPAQKPHVFKAPATAHASEADPTALTKQLEELQRRVALGCSTGAKPSSSNLASILKGPVDVSAALPAVSGSQSIKPTIQRSGSVRFEDSHDKHFSRWDLGSSNCYTR